MVYQWKIPLYKVSAQAAGEELERIGAGGDITPDLVVDNSRPADAVLHGCFEWDDATAAEEWRKEQAKTLIRNVVTVMAESGSQEPVRAFVSIQDSYKPIATVLVSEDYTAAMLEDALRDLKAFQRKYAALKELAAIFQAIESIA